MTKIKKPNHLDFCGARTTFSPPQHFTYINIPVRYNILESLDKWISQHLKGRYYIGRIISINQENNIVEQCKIGFEEPKELSYFTLACPLLKYN